MKKRRSIPKYIETQLLYETDSTCCICQKPGRSIQFHHIDGDPSNIDFQNLAVLCHDHHDQASMRSRLSRGLTPGLVRKHMDDWLRRVRSRRAIPAAIRSNLAHEAMLETLAVHEIRKIHSALMEATWGGKVLLLNLLNPYTDFRYGYESRTEILSTLNHLAGETRMGMPYEVACKIGNLTESVLPIFSLVRPARTQPKKKDITLLREATDIGSNIAYDAAKYLRDIGVATEGSSLLWTVLRFAHLNNIQGLRKEILDEFHSLEKTAELVGLSDGQKWFEFERLDAQALKGDPLPKMPKKLFMKLLQLKRPLAKKKAPKASDP